MKRLMIGILAFAGVAMSIGYTNKFLSIANAQQPASSTWQVQFGSSNEDGLTSFVLAPSAAIYCVGNTGGTLSGASGSGDVFLSKYTTSGSLLWLKQLGSAAGETVSGSAVDAFSNLYVVGNTRGTLYGNPPGPDSSNSFLAKYDPNGTLVWGQQFGSSETDGATQVTIATDGSIYVAGYTGGDFGGTNAGYSSDPSLSPGTSDIYLARFSSNGTLLWKKQFGAMGDDIPSGISLDSNGNAILIGTTYQWFKASHGGRDVFLVKLDANGNILWNDEFGSTSDNSPSGFFVDRSNNIMLATVEGDSQTADGRPINGLCKLYKFDTNGHQQWVQQFATSDPTDRTEITGITSVGQALYVSGNTTGNLFGLCAGLQNLFIAQLSSSGTVVMSNEFGTTSTDQMVDLVSDTSGNLYLGGITDGNLFANNLGQNDIFLEKQVVTAQASGLPAKTTKKENTFTAWNGQSLQLTYPSTHVGNKAYVFAGYLHHAIDGARTTKFTRKDVTISGIAQNVVFHINSAYYRVNDLNLRMSSPPLVKQGRVYLPVDVFQHFYGFPVVYNPTKRMVDFKESNRGKRPPPA
jgi:hypothetical protein